MEVVVHGTNGGYDTLHKRQSAPAIASDIRNNSNSLASLGKSVYAIAFVTNGSVFSKYMVVKDTLRSSAPGFIAFSLFIPKNDRLSGVDIKSLLDELQSHYVDTYIQINQMNLGEKNQIIHEDWTFINDILSKYKVTNNVSHNQFKSGTKKPAFIRYKSDSELIEYLDQPFQEEYSDYKQVLLISEQVLLIKSELKKNSDILNFIENSGNELHIDFENEYYYLNDKDLITGLTIKVNGKRRDGQKNYFRRNDNIEIEYNKDDRFYLPIKVSGTLSNTASDIYNYFNKRGNLISIKNEAFNKPESKKKIISFRIRDRHGNLVNLPEISCKSNYVQKTVNNDEIVFSGEDLGKTWKVQASTEDNLISDDYQIDFKRDCPGDEGTIDLKLNERKKVRFLGILGDTPIEDIKVTIKRKNNYPVEPEVEFVNEEIESTFFVTATYQKDSDKYSGELPSFSPKHNDEVRIDLEKEKIPKYQISSGEHGEKAEDCPGYSVRKDGSDIKTHIKSKRGWKFTGFKFEENSENNDFDGCLVAQYEKKYKPFTIAALIFSVVVVSSVIWWFLPNENVEKSFLSVNDINQYVEGTELNVDTLKVYKNEWNKQNSDNEKEDTFVWYDPMTWMNGEEPNSIAIDDSKNEKVIGWIDRAIKKRKHIDSLDYNVLKDSTKYSENQLEFKGAIMKVDSSNYDTIRVRFKDISKWDLNQIADSIHSFLDPKVIENNESQADEPAKHKKESDKKIKAPKKKAPSKEVEKNSTETTKTVKPETVKKASPKSSSRINEIKSALSGSSVTKSELKEYKKENHPELNSSIDFYIDFWDLVKNSNQKSDFNKLLKKIKLDSNLKNSDLKKFLNNICRTNEDFRKYREIPGKHSIKNIEKLKQKYKTQ